jgi:hypothetical protein
VTCLSICITTDNRALLRLADKQVNVLRHDHVAGYIASIPAANALQFMFERLPGHSGAEQLHAPITTESDEMEAALVLKTLRLWRHRLEIVSHPPANDAGRVGQPLCCFTALGMRCTIRNLRLAHPARYTDFR